MKRLFLYVVFFAMGSVCWAKTAEKVLDEMTERLAGFKDFQVTVEVNSWVKSPQGKKTASSSATLMAQGEKRYSETIGSDTEGNSIDRVQVFDGKASWDYDRVRGVIKKVDIYKLSEGIREKLKKGQDPTNLGFIGKLKYDREERKLNGRPYFVLTSSESISIGNQSFDKVVIWIDAESYLLNKLEMESTINIPLSGGPQSPEAFRSQRNATVQGLQISQGVMQEFKDWKVNSGIPDYRFSLSIPEGVKVIDETERAQGLARFFIQQEEMREKSGGSVSSPTDF